MVKYTKDDGTIKCTNRLLTMVLVAISIQTILFVGLTLGIYMAYDTHKHDLNALGAVPWGDMADDLKEQYLTMDKHAINDIIKNSKNLTNKANILIHSHGETIATDAVTITSKAAKNTDLIDTVRKIIFDVQKPVNELGKLITHDNTMDIHTLIKTIKHISSQIDNIQVKNIADTVLALLKKLLNGLTPEALKSIETLLKQLNEALKNDNIHTIHTLAEDTDKSIKSINNFLNLIGNINKKP